MNSEEKYPDKYEDAYDSFMKDIRKKISDECSPLVVGLLNDLFSHFRASVDDEIYFKKKTLSLILNVIKGESK